MPCWRSRLSVLVRSPLVRVAERLQFALEVVPVYTVDGEARLLDDLGHPTCQMTPARERLPERFYPFLPPCDARIGRVAVFDEVERAAGLQDAKQLGECPIDVRDRAQRPRGQRGIEALGWEVQLLAGQSGRFQRDVVLVDARPSNVHGHLRRFDGIELRDLAGVVGRVQPRAE